MEPRIFKRNVVNSSRRRNKKTVKSVDRISALPDSILGAILSLLPTKNAVATSTLSKRWEYVWRTVHNLDFCLEGLGRTDEQVEDENKKFISFVNRVLLHLDVGVLNKFCLVWSPEFIQFHSTSWIKTAITRNVHELSLTLESYSHGRIEMLPLSVFSCASLQSLKLSGWICLSAATVFCFPRLESLHFDGVTFESGETFEKIIKACPVLNYLNIIMDAYEYLDDDEEEDYFRFIITSTSLRCLELDLGWVRRSLKLEASSLEYLKIFNRGYVDMDFVQNNLSSLVEANFKMRMDCDRDDICNSVVDAVSALDCVKILTLSEYVMQALSCATINLSTDFKRLVKLETHIVCCRWSSLQDFIHNSNNLKVLTVHKHLIRQVDENSHDHSNWTTPVDVPRCLSTSLKNVVLIGYYGYEDEREMIRYMLKHGSVLEDMQISYHRDITHRDIRRKKIELRLQEICQFPRKSLTCEVKFSTLPWQ